MREGASAPKPGMDVLGDAAHVCLDVDAALGTSEDPVNFSHASIHNNFVVYVAKETIESIRVLHNMT